MESEKSLKHNVEASKKHQYQYQPPAPERFIEYERFPNNKGFNIPDTNHKFYFDVFGGWFDSPKSLKLN